MVCSHEYYTTIKNELLITHNKMDESPIQIEQIQSDIKEYTTELLSI